MSSLLENRWVSRLKPVSQATSRIFCFPYAGGGAQIFWTWPKHIPATTEVCAVQLPGRGSRLAETPFSRMRPLVSALAEAILPLLDKPFFFFGHSMGAWLSFEVARRLRTTHQLEPGHLFVSGACAPQIPSRESPIHNLPDPELRKALKNLDGTPREVLESDELMNILLPIMRADFAVCETYKYVSGRPMSCPISAYGGLEDKRLLLNDLKAWQKQTTGTFSLSMFPGNHFFLHANERSLLRAVAIELEKAENGNARA